MLKSAIEIIGLGGKWEMLRSRVTGLKVNAYGDCSWFISWKGTG